MHNPEVLVAATLAAVLIIVPLPSQLRGRNVAVLVLMAGTFLLNIVYVVNVMVWAESVHDVAPVWCDIATNFWFYYPLLAVGAALCVCKHLKWISSPRNTTLSRPRRVLFEIAFCCVLPLVSIPIRYTLASNRYVILEGLGCFPLFYDSSLTMAFTFGPQLGIVVASLAFACIAAWNLVRRRIRLSTQFDNSQSALSTSRLVRLLLVCAIMGIWPAIATFICFRQIGIDLSPWPGWAATHSHFNDIPRIPLFFQPPGFRQSLLTIIWVDISTAYIAIAILTCTEAAREDFRRAWTFVRRKVPCLGETRSHNAPAPSSQWFDSPSANESDRSLLARLVDRISGGRKASSTNISRQDRFVNT